MAKSTLRKIHERNKRAWGELFEEQDLLEWRDLKAINDWELEFLLNVLPRPTLTQKQKDKLNMIWQRTKKFRARFYESKADFLDSLTREL